MINLNNGKDRLKTGVYIAANSFLLLWTNKILFIYLAIILGAYKIIQLLSYNLEQRYVNFTYIHQAIPLALSQWYNHLFFLILTFCYLFLLTCVTVSLIYHTAKLIEHESVILQDSFNYIRKKMMVILIWSSISTLVTYILQITTTWKVNVFLSPIMFLITILGLVWSLVTLMVLPIITIEKISVWQAIKKSQRIIVSLLLEIIAGEFWIGLIATLAFIPLLLLGYIFKVTFMFIIIEIAFFMILWIIATVQVIFKTMVYIYYMEPLKELATLKYPRF